MHKRRVFLFVTALTLMFVVAFHHAVQTVAQSTSPVFVDPTAPAPSGSTKPFIDTSSDPQVKEGSLIIDGTGPVSVTIGVAGETGNALVINGITAQSLGTPFDAIQVEKGWPSNQPAHEGFVSIQAQAGQQWALGALGDARSPAFLWQTALVGDAGGPGTAAAGAFGIRGEASVNNDTAYAVYGLDDQFDPADVPNNSSAAKFDGKVGISGDVIIGDGTYKKRLCLNGQDIGNCISSWDPEGFGFQFLHLQAAGTVAAAQSGAVSLLGNAQMGQLVVGPTTGIDSTLTQGDGSCQPGESGPPDCI